MAGRLLFAPGPMALARVPLLPFHPARQDEADGVAAEGIFLASRALDETVSDGPKAAASRAAYAIRARSRTVPHSVWCGVAAARIEGEEPGRLGLGEAHRAVTHPAPQFLWSLGDRLIGEPGVVEAVMLTASNLVVRRGDRFETEHPGPKVGQLGSIRAAELSGWLIRLCAGGARGSDVLAAVLERYPGASVEAARGAVAEMVRTGILLTDLLPEDLRDDPLGHLVDRLPEAIPERVALVRLRQSLRAADHLPPGVERRLKSLSSARELADSLHRVERPLVVDTLVDAELRLPARVGEEAAAAATVLWRISHRAGPLRAWTRKFADVYGRHRLVPLLEAIDPAAGIGPPAREDAIAATAEPDERRTRLLAALLGEALVHGRDEVELTDADIDRLRTSEGLPPRTAEIHVRVLPCRDGSFQLMIGQHAAQEAGSAAGRFARWLPELAPSVKDHDEAVAAEIVCRPLTHRAATLAVETRFAPYRIPIGTPPRKGDLLPHDLAITLSGRRLILWSHALNRPVVPVLFSRISRDLLPPAARLLHLLGHADERPWHTWSWGSGDVMPYTPRVSYRTTVLAPQRWLLPDELTAAATRKATWQRRFTQWLAEARPPLPQLVVAEESDRHLPLNPRDPVQAEILRRSVVRGTRALTEAIGYGPQDLAVQGPQGRHPLELVIPLHRLTTLPVPSVEPRAAARRLAKDSETPGNSAWLSAAIAIPARHQDAALASLPDTSEAVRMFWLRYETPDLGPHLRLRYYTDDPETRARISGDLAVWAADLAQQWLSNGVLRFEPYVRETQRYGGPGAIAAAEEVFAADSALVLTTLRHGPPPEAERLIIAAHSAATIAQALDAPDAARPAPLPPAERRIRDQLRPAARSYTLPPGLAATWDARHQALTNYRATLFTPDIARLCASDVIHLHANRLLGMRADHERLARSLATDLLHTRG
ncbi:lantibiotic dehydratase [Streptomyces millisiae]|uniref:Lantibiotic dehydratase n=1 Tax=Streptomyces millisiae TaxID=3075542 RepID=A0ABU2LZZ0_9ACTN|nr:lantibiotic dehydratase [Streptomyces sp. DSM 44918]MDT0322878.1 lantibiotic dehydratase [Streptomyces sp. DSM 44918]